MGPDRSNDNVHGPDGTPKAMWEVLRHGWNTMKHLGTP